MVLIIGLLPCACLFGGQTPAVVRESRETSLKEDGEAEKSSGKEEEQLNADSSGETSDEEDGNPVDQDDSSDASAEDTASMKGYIDSLLETYEVSEDPENGLTAKVSAPDIAQAVEQLSKEGKELTMENLQAAAASQDSRIYEFPVESADEEAVKAAFRDAVVHEVLIFALKNLQPAEEAAE